MSEPTHDTEFEKAALNLLGRVLDREQDERESFLEEACSGDARLRNRVRELLEADRTQTPLEPIGGLPSLDAYPVGEVRVLEAGKRIGSYRLVRPIGRGGIGQVYEAVQDQPARRVALKMLRHGFETPAALRRFRYESEVLGHLRHPGIAQVYEAGSHEGMPFIVLEYVEGAETLVAYARKAGLDRKGRWRLFLRVLEAIRYAHDNGVIHRDLKPGNILVDQKGVPKVIDFGLARSSSLELSLAESSHGRLAGTLYYMSPEQLSLEGTEPDVRCDVYSLAVVLYELILDRLPFDVEGMALGEVARRITSLDPVRPRQVKPELSEDEEAILLMGLAADRSRRYPSAEALARDIENLLGSQPVQARVPGLGYRLRLFARRNRALVAAGAVVSVSLLATTAASVHSAVRAREAAVVEREAKEEVQQFRDDLFDLNYGLVLEAEEDLVEMEGTAEARFELTRKAVERLRRLQPSVAGDMERSLKLVEAYLGFGNLLGNPNQLSNAGDVDGARRTMEDALELALEYVDASEHARDLELNARNYLAEILVSQAEYPQAIAQLEQVVEGYRPRIAETGSRTLRKELGGALRLLARCHSLRGQPEQAVPCAEAALENAQDLAEDYSDDPSSLFDVADSNQVLGLMLHKVGSHEEARAAFEEALGLFSILEEESPAGTLHRTKIGETLLHAAKPALALEDFEGAHLMLEQARAVWAELQEVEPFSGFYVYWDACTLSVQGRAYEASGELEEARGSYEQSIAAFEEYGRKAESSWQAIEDEILRCRTRLEAIAPDTNLE